MKLLQRLDDIISPVQDFGQGSTPGKHPRQTLPGIPIIETEQSHQIDVNFNFDWSAQIFVMKSHESHFWQQAFTPHYHSFSSGQSLSKLAAGWRIMAGIEKCYASANYQMKLLPGRRKCHFTWAGLWAALDVWWLPKAVDLTWQMNLVKKCYLASLIKVFNAVTEKVWGKNFLNY